jgi:hypothetical protein
MRAAAGARIPPPSAYLRTNAPIPGLSKYQQALVRPTLSTILSVPIFDPGRFSAGREDAFNPLIGILNFDSDSASVPEFMSAVRSRRHVRRDFDGAAGPLSDDGASGV